jgi:hypothetical protein
MPAPRGPLAGGVSDWHRLHRLVVRTAQRATMRGESELARELAAWIRRSDGVLAAAADAADGRNPHIPLERAAKELPVLARCLASARARREISEADHAAILDAMRLAAHRLRQGSRGSVVTRREGH